MFLVPFGSRRTTRERRLCADTGGPAAGIFESRLMHLVCIVRLHSGEVEGGNAWKKQKDYKDEKQQSCKLIQHLQVILQPSAALRLSICCSFFGWWWWWWGGDGGETVSGGQVMLLTASSSSTPCNLLFCFGEFLKKLPNLHQLPHCLF